MTEAMPFLQKAILLSYDPRPLRGVFFHILPFPSPFGMIEKSGSLPPAGRGESAQRRDS